MRIATPPVAGAIVPAETDGQKKNTERTVLYWHDPMRPDQKFDKPGKSPYMDMQLVPVYADEAGDEGKTRISPRVQQNLGIRTASVTRGALQTAVTAVGSVAYNDRDVVLVQARSNGFVERLHVRAPLDPVRAGQPLVDLYVPDWVAAQEEFLSVSRMQGRATEGLVDGAKQRMRLAGMTDDQIRAVATSGTIRPRFTLTAPIGGVVTELMAREGMTVMAGAPLFRINGIGTIWVNAEVPESLSALVRPGTPVEAATPALPGKTFRGRVARILPEVNAQTRTIKARIELANPSGQLSPGMFATIEFRSASREDVLLVPTEAVIQTGKRTVVVAALDDGRFAPVEVEIGAEANGQTEIRKGLTTGQKVVTSGQFLIDSEASLRATATRMSDAPGARPETSGQVHRGEGKVESVGKDEITLSHGPIPSLNWAPMTMAFMAPASGLPRGIRAGDHVQFEFRQAGEGVYEITSIAAGAATKAAADPATRGTPGTSGASHAHEAKP
jgi:Cu(I)/Ag(I) efflux system membrane fusion protein